MSSPIFIILSAGKPRIRGCNCASPLIPFNGTKLINKQVSVIGEVFKNPKIILVSGYKFDEVKEYVKAKHPKIRLLNNKEHLETSSVDSLKLAMKYCNNRDLFIIHGDRVFSKTSIIKRKESYTLYYDIDEKNQKMGLSIDDEDDLLNMSYGLDKVWSEITFLSKRDVSKVKRQIEKKHYSLPELINASDLKLDVLYSKNIKELRKIL